MLPLIHPTGQRDHNKLKGIQRFLQRPLIVSSQLKSNTRTLQIRVFGHTRSSAQLIQRSRFNFLREAQIWYNRGADQPVLSEEFENVIALSDEFYREVSEHPIPTDLEAVRVLSASPAVLDLFMWLSYRCFLAKREESIPFSGGLGLSAQLGNVEYARPRKFREKLHEWLGIVKTMWPECPVLSATAYNGSSP